MGNLRPRRRVSIPVRVQASFPPKSILYTTDVDGKKRPMLYQSLLGFRRHFYEDNIQRMVTNVRYQSLLGFRRYFHMALADVQRIPADYHVSIPVRVQAAFPPGLSAVIGRRDPRAPTAPEQVSIPVRVQALFPYALVFDYVQLAVVPGAYQSLLGFRRYFHSSSRGSTTSTTMPRINPC